MSESTTDGFSAWVTIDGVKLPQYGTETTIVEGVKTVTCWIASEVDKEFAVGWSVPTHPEQLIGRVHVDGVCVGGTIHSLAKPSTATKTSAYVSNTVARALIFSKLESTDEDAYLGTNLKDLGNIVVKIWVGKRLESPSQISDAHQLPMKIHERTKKAISHRVILGKEFVIARQKLSRSTYDRLLMSFVFKYRSREYLQAEGIMPSDPKPDVRPHKRPAETLEPSTSGDEEETEVHLRNEELRLRQEQLQLRKEELQIRNEELQIQLDIIKAKRQKRVKLEPQATKMLVKAETIDLT